MGISRLVRQALLNMLDARGIRVQRVRRGDDQREFAIPHDLDQRTADTIRKVLPYTMTSVARIGALCESIQYISDTGLAGSIVECGVWRGGSMLAAAETLSAAGDLERDLYLFDTFEGMSAPTAFDVRASGVAARDLWEQARRGDGASDWCYADIADVRAVMGLTEYPAEKVHFIKGKVEDTLPERAPENIALLRLDTDWYESTRHELNHLFDRISPGGILILDDYGDWQGAKRAVDEFIAERGLRLYLQRLDDSGRLVVVP